jgi:hypothetical protein
MTLEDARDYVWEHGKPLPASPATRCRVDFELPYQAPLAEEFQKHVDALNAHQGTFGSFTVPLPLSNSMA